MDWCLTNICKLKSPAKLAGLFSLLFNLHFLSSVSNRSICFGSVWCNHVCRVYSS
jgi:hypothetical protein